ncbi:MAG: hypothetical protein HQK50_17300 [Oligoflexia bacterium]|nr:hypothetical protein [Oligoflexia bacterium]MBF0367335.1 hypothetical protein [Oligoflexia bacterium]
MKYLSIDIESTGLDEDCLLIEFAAIPFDTCMPLEKSLEHTLAFHSFIQCPSFELLRPKLNPWVAEHNESLIRKAASCNITLATFGNNFKQYLQSSPIKNYFLIKNENDQNKDQDKIVLFGKSLNAIDLPFLRRDLGSDFMNTFFLHKVMDLTAFAFGLIDLNLLPEGVHSSSELMKHFKMGEVSHTALDDAKNTAIIYMRLLDYIKTQKLLHSSHITLPTTGL